MSYSKVTKMHCKVCESAGKSDKEIRSHYPKNRDGFTVCPTLLSQECRYCNKKGHTIKYCSKKTKDSDNTWILQQERQYANEKANKKAAKILLASFDALYESSDDEVEVEVVVPQQKEIRSTKYMDALLQAKPVEAKQVEAKPIIAKTPKMPKIVAKLNWATADTDSEGDDSESDM